MRLRLAMPRTGSRILFAMVVLFAVTTRSVAQEGVPSLRPASLLVEAADNASLAHLARVDVLLKQGEVSEGVETLRQLIESGGEQLVVIDSEVVPGFRRYGSLREYSQIKLAELARSSPAALEFYRELADPIAEEYLRRDAAGDATALQQIVDKLLVSSAGDEALLKLGERALQRAHWSAARNYWERISPRFRFAHENEPWRVLTGQPLWLLARQLRDPAAWSAAEPLLLGENGGVTWAAHPDTNLGLADVRARLALVSILEGNRDRAAAEIELLERAEPNAVGRLGGQRGPYVALLRELLKASETWYEPVPDPGWLTFAGSAARNKHAPSVPDPLQGPRWTAPLPRFTGEREYFSSEGQRVGESLDELLSYHPIVAHDQVIIQTGPESTDVQARQLADGKFLFGEPAVAETGAEPMVLPYSVGVPRFSLTAQGRIVYASVGVPAGPPPARASREGNPSRIIGLDLSAQGRLLLEIRLDPAEWAAGWSFGGPPVSDGQRLFVALRQRDAAHAKAHAACYDARTGRRLWRRLVCGSETPVDRPLELTHTLLTLRDGVLYYNTNLGGVAALRADDGVILWLTEYPRADFQSKNPDRQTQHAFRDLNPCLLHEDFVIAAPLDTDRLFVLDANTGHLLWSTLPEQAAGVIHLLGVGQQHLLASGDYLYWFDVHTGQLRAQFPGPRKALPGLARPSPRGSGRGVLVGDNIYWPTGDAIFVFRQRPVRTEAGWEPVLTRVIDLAARGLRGGNLVSAEGRLLIATGNRIDVFD